jgi:hypothetical protein
MITPVVKLAARRIPVFPCSQDKQPHTARGFKDASTNEESVVDFTEFAPDAAAA